MRALALRRSWGRGGDNSAALAREENTVQEMHKRERGRRKRARGGREKEPRSWAHGKVRECKARACRGPGIGSRGPPCRGGCRKEREGGRARVRGNLRNEKKVLIDTLILRGIQFNLSGRF